MRTLVTGHGRAPAVRPWPIFLNRLTGLGLAALLALGVGTARAQSPVTSGLRLHLRADVGVTTSGANVTSWADQSGNANNATPASGTAPTYQASVVNGRPVIRITNGNLSTPAINLTSTSQVDYFIVAKSRSAGINGLVEASSNYNLSPTGWTLNDNDNSCGGCPGGLVASLHGNVGYSALSGTASQNLQSAFGIAEALFDKSLTTQEAKVRLNGTNLSAVQSADANNTNTFGSDILYIGGRSPSPVAQEDIAEVLVFDRILTASERTQVETYLSNRYGIATSANPTPTSENAVLLNGTTDFIAATGPVFSAASPLTQFTMEWWMKVNSFTHGAYMAAFSQAVAAFPASGNPINFFCGNSASSFGLEGSWTDGSNLNLRTTIPFGTGAWHHVAVTYDGSTARQYVDGTLLNSVNYAGKSLGNAHPFRIGRGYAYPGSLVNTFFGGEIDEMRVWNVARTQAQIQAARNGVLTGGESGLIAYYDMNRTGQGAGLSVSNRATLTGSSFDGTTTGSASTPVFTASSAPFSSAPVLTAVAPTRNLPNALRTANVALTFDQTMNAGSASATALKVFGQMTGKRAAAYSGGGTTTLTIDPTADFLPNERVEVTVTTAAQSSGGTPLARGYVNQFIAAAGPGDGAFGGGSNPTGPSQPTQVKAADFDNDGDLDLVAASYGGSGLMVWLNNGAGGFGAGTSYGSGSIHGVATGDIDGDGDVDLVAALYAGGGSTSLPVFFNNGAGAFPTTGTVSGVGSGPTDVALGDIDGDGDLDAVSANYTAGSFSTAFNNGSGVFSGIVSTSLGANVLGAGLADFDEDGDLDLAISRYTSSGVTTYTNNGSGVFSSPASQATGTNPGYFYPADLDGDGHADMAISNYGSGTVTLLWGSGTGTFTTQTLNSISVNNVTAYPGDVDGDGDLDLLVSNWSTANVVLVRNTGTRTFGLPTNIPVQAPNYHAILADLNGDLTLDLASANIGGNSVSVRFTSPPGLPFSARAARIQSARYWFDAGGKTVMAAADGSFNAELESAIATAGSALSVGAHTLNVEMQGEDGGWGNTFSTVLTVDAPLVIRPINITAGEVWFDSGTPVAMVAFDGAFDQAVERVVKNALATTGLSLGAHKLNIHLQGAEGSTWGPTFSTVLTVATPLVARPVNITAGEVWFDSNAPVAMLAFDGAFDQAVETVVKNALATTGLSLGAHKLNVHLQGAEGSTWGPTFSTVLTVATPLVARPVNITAGEVWFDSGTTVAMLAFDGAFDQAVETAVKNALATTGLSLGAHKLNVHLQGAEGSTWGPTFSTVLTIATPIVARPVRITAGEMWWDSQAAHTPMLAFDGNFDQAVEAATGVLVANGLSVGPHVLNVRMQGDDGSWGNTMAQVVTVDACTAPATPTAGALQTTIFAGQNINLTASTVAGATYQWRGPNGFSSTQQNPQVAGATTAATGTYWVKALSASNCPSPEDSVNVKVLPPVLISTDAIAPTSICAGTSFSVGYTVTSGTLNAGNQFRAQLSDDAGSFNSPTQIGAITSTAGSGSIPVTIPGGTITGINYRIRVVSTNPAVNGTDNGAALTITQPFTATATATPAFSPVGGTVQLAVTGAPGGATYAWTGPNSYTSAQASPQLTSIQTTATGTYNVTVTKGGCSSSSSVFVRVYDCATNLGAGLPAGSYFQSAAFGGSSAQSAFNGGGWNANGFSGTMGVGFGTAETFTRLAFTPTPGPGPGTGTITLQVATDPGLTNWVTFDNLSQTYPASPAQRITRTYYASPISGYGLRLAASWSGSWVAISDMVVENCPGPFITSFTPTNGPVGTSVTITGGNFTGTTSVSFNGTSAPGFVVNSATQITVAAPAGGTSGPLTVTTPNGSATSSQSYIYPGTITTGAIAPTLLCAGSTIGVPYTVTGAFQPNNTFTSQLLDSLGNAINLANLFNSTTGGTISSPLPTGLAYGTKYRIRVVSSNPALTGSDNGADLTLIDLNPATATSNSPVNPGGTIQLDVTGVPAASLATYAWSKIAGGGSFSSSQRNPQITGAAAANAGTYQVVVSRGSCSVTRSVVVSVAAPTIAVTAPTSGQFCAGGSISVTFTTSSVFNAGNVFTARMISLSSPTTYTLGTLTATTNGTINGTIPANVPTNTNYRVVVDASDPAASSPMSSTNLTVVNFGTMAATSNSPVATGGTIQLDVTGTVAGLTYAWSGPGTFSNSAIQNPTISGATTANSGTYQVVVSYGPSCGTTLTTNVTVNPPAPTNSITTTGPTSGTYCAGSPIFVDFTTTGTFQAGNVFTAQLSDASGSFASPTTIGTVNGPGSGSGQIGGALPAGLTAGSGYLVRVISSQPAVTGTTAGPLTVSSTSFTWVGGTDSNWNNPANWSCGVVPGANDDVTINPGGNSPVVGSGGAVVRSITINASATLTVNTTFTIHGNLVNNGTIGAGSGSGWVWAGTGGTWTVGGSGTFNFWHVTVNNTVNLTVNQNITVHGNVVNNGSLTQPWNYFLYLPGTSSFSGNPMTWGTYYVQTGGSVSWLTGLTAWSLYNGGAINTGTQTFTFGAGGGAGSIGGAGSNAVPFYDVVFNNPAGVTQVSDVELYHFWTNNFVFNPGTRRITFTGPGVQISGPNVTFYDIVINSTADVTLNVDITILGDLINNGAFHCGTQHVIFNGTTQVIGGSVVTNFFDITFNNTVNLTLNQNIIVDGDWLNHGTFSGVGHYVLFSGTAAQTVGGAGSTHFGTVRWNNAAGVTLGGAIRVAGDFAYLGGVWSAGGFGVTFDGTLTQSILGPNVPVFAGLVNNNTSVTGLTLGVSIRATGNLSGTGRFCGCGFETWLNGTSAQTISGPGRWDFYHIRINNTLNVTLNVDIHVLGHWTCDGPFNPNGFTVFFDGVAIQLIRGSVITNFYHVVINNVVNVTLNQTIRVRGNFSGPGRFTGDGWYTIFDGSAAQTISACSCTRFGHLTFNNAGGVTLLTGIGLTGDFLNTGGFLHGGQTVGFYGTGTQTINGAGIVFGNVYTATGATASLGVPVSFSGNLTNDGAWLANTHACSFIGAACVIGGANVPLFYHLYIELNAQVTLNVNVSLTGDFRHHGVFIPGTRRCIFAGTVPQRIYGTATIFNFYDITVNTLAVVNVEVDIHLLHDLLNNGTINWPNLTTVFCDGTTAQVLGGSTVTRFHHLTCNNAAGVSLSQNIRIAGNFRDLAGWHAGPWLTTFDGSGAQSIFSLPGGGTTFGGMTFNNAAGVTLFGPVSLTGDFRNTAGFLHGGFGVTFAGTGTQNVFGPSQCIFHHLTIAAGATLQLNLDIYLTGNWTNHNVFLPNGWTVYFIGTVAQTIGGGAVTNFHHLMINNTVSVSLTQDIRIRGNFLDNGVFCGCGHLTTFDGTAPQTIACHSGNTRFHHLTFANNTGVTLLDAIGVTGNWVNNGGFNAGGQLVLFAGTVGQTIGGSVLTTFHHWQNTNNGAGAGVSLIRDVAYTGNWTNNGRYCGCGFLSSFVGTAAQTLTCTTGQSNFHHLTLNNQIGVTLTGNINVYGNWLLTGVWNPQTYTVFFLGTGAQSISVGGLVTTCNFHGLTIGNTSSAGVSLTCPLYLTGNWTNNGTFICGQNTVFAVGTVGQVFGGSQPSTFWNWTMQNPVGATCNGPIRIIRILTMDTGSGNLACGGFLLLVSNAQGTAMVVNVTGGGECTGLATMERAITGANAKPGYRHYSSPMRLGSARVNEFADDLPFFSINPAYNANPNTATPFPTLFQYDESRMTTADNSFIRGYLVPPGVESPLDPGRGYSAMTNPTTVVDITGVLQNGNVTAPTLTRGGFAESGWNLIGNPYPAPIDWRLLTLPATLDNAVYVHKPTGKYSGTYASWVNGVAQNGGSPVLPAMQGFFTHLNQPGSTSLTFTNAARATTYTSPTFWRQAPGATEQRPQLRLAVRSQVTGREDEAVVYFEEGSSRTFDRDFDAAKQLLAAPDYPTLWSEMGAGKYAINGLPVADLTSGVVIPLGVRVPQDGQYVLAAARLLNLPAGTPVWLEDRQLGVVRNLTVDSLYQFTMKAATTAPRFFLNVGRTALPVTTPTLDLRAATLDVYPNPAQAELVVRLEELPADLAAVRVTLTSVLGKEVVTDRISADNGTAAARLDVSRLPQGVYTLRLTAPGNSVTWTRKVVVSH